MRLCLKILNLLKIQILSFETVSFPYSVRKWRGPGTKITHLSHQEGVASNFRGARGGVDHMGEEGWEPVSPEFNCHSLIRDH